jgi:organic hydroperoxide reductase OsmC/OhrA
VSEYKATIRWAHTEGDFLKGTYSRGHEWHFDGGITVPASSSPHAVRKPFSKEDAVDPEEAFVASIAGCHMLTFLWLASKDGFAIRSYEDDAVGVMTKNERGALWVSAVTLRPRIAWEGAAPPPEHQERLHHAAHEGCYIAQSVKTAITVEPADAPAGSAP